MYDLYCQDFHSDSKAKIGVFFFFLREKDVFASGLVVPLVRLGHICGSPHMMKQEAAELAELISSALATSRSVLELCSCPVLISVQTDGAA